MNESSDNTDSPTLKNLPFIETEKALRKIINGYPKMMDKRVQDSLDYFSEEFIAVASAAIVATDNTSTEGGEQSSMFLSLCQPDGLSVRDKQQLTLSNVPNSNVKHCDKHPVQASLYFLAPGIGHALRINGTLELEPASSVHDCYVFNISQVYFHCARAAARANLWQPQALPKLNHDNFISNASYLLLKTKNTDGHTEISPRGDGAGFVKQISENTLLIPERPGNKIAVSLRNIIDGPAVELLFIAPGSNHTLNIQGTAKLISNCELLEQCAVNGKAPKVGILITTHASSFQLDPALAAGDIWNAEKFNNKSAITSFPKALSAHINGTGLLGKATATLVGAVVKHDMKNLY